jgi:protease-4
MFASMFGFIIAGLVLIFIVAGIIGAAVSSVGGDNEANVKDKSILQISFNEEIHDRSNDNPFAGIKNGSFETEKKLGLYHILNAIENAKTDSKIKGIFLDLEGVNTGIASMNEIRNALLDFKKSNKFIVAYSEAYSQKSYFMASVANAIYLHPQGDLEWKGLGAEFMFLKHTLEKLEIEPQIIRHGKFKSAVEPFTEEKMSAANRIQTRSYMSDIGRVWLMVLHNKEKSMPIKFKNLPINYQFKLLKTH